MWRGVHGVRRKIASAEMSSLKEQRCSVKFCVKLGKSFMETFEFITKAYGEDAMKRTVFYEWFTRFIKGWQSAEDDEHSGGPSMLIDDSLHWESERSRSCKSTLDCQGICRRVWHLDWFMLWNPNWKLRMHWVATKFVLRLMTADQKQQSNSSLLGTVWSSWRGCNLVTGS